MSIDDYSHTVRTTPIFKFGLIGIFNAMVFQSPFSTHDRNFKRKLNGLKLMVKYD